MPLESNNVPSIDFVPIRNILTITRSTSHNRLRTTYFPLFTKLLHDIGEACHSVEMIAH